ncbi:MAG: hypothetical protein SGI97_04930 [candidate division Zixibacteria bacterium]|nr:hypothetical protein [candidate division Zixibacteria bacterium]
MQTSSVGIEIGLETHTLVQVSSDGGRPEVKQLRLVDRGQLSESLAIHPKAMSVVLPDSETIVKMISLPNHGHLDKNAVAEFEFAQSLLDDKNAFRFITMPGFGEEKQLGVAFRKSREEHLVQTIVLSHSLHGTAIDTIPRALALGRGYLNFCLPDESEFLCLVDVHKQTELGASICFLYKRAIIGLARVGFEQAGAESDEQCKAIGFELKTIINFHLAGLFDIGLTRPLGTILLSGEPATNRLCATLTTLFPVGVASPKANYGYFTNVDEADILPENCLAALGATVSITQTAPTAHQ